MSSLKLVSTVKFANSKGSEAKYEIYHDAVSNDYQAEVSYLTDVLSTAGFTARVWYKTPLTLSQTLKIAAKTILKVTKRKKTAFGRFFLPSPWVDSS